MLANETYHCDALDSPNCSAIFSYASDKGENGGDETGLQFRAAFAIAIQKARSNAQLKDFVNRRDWISFANKVTIITVDNPLVVGQGLSSQNSVAMNDTPTMTIKVNRSRWAAITDAVLREGIALHEFVSLAGLESTGKYPISSKYVEAFGGSADELESALGYQPGVAEIRDLCDANIDQSGNTEIYEHSQSVSVPSMGSQFAVSLNCSGSPAGEIVVSKIVDGPGCISVGYGSLKEGKCSKAPFATFKLRDQAQCLEFSNLARFSGTRTGVSLRIDTKTGSLLSFEYSKARAGDWCR